MTLDITKLTQAVNDLVGVVGPAIQSATDEMTRVAADLKARGTSASVDDTSLQATLDGYAGKIEAAAAGLAAAKQALDAFDVVAPAPTPVPTPAPSPSPAPPPPPPTGPGAPSGTVYNLSLFSRTNGEALVASPDPLQGLQAGQTVAISTPAIAGDFPVKSAGSVAGGLTVVHFDSPGSDVAQEPVSGTMTVQ